MSPLNDRVRLISELIRLKFEVGAKDSMLHGLEARTDRDDPEQMSRLSSQRRIVADLHIRYGDTLNHLCDSYDSDTHAQEANRAGIH